MFEDLTKKQKDVMDFLKGYFKEYGVSPSYQEVADGLGLLSRATILKHLKGLKEKGYLSYKEGVIRSIRLREGLVSKVRAVEVPLLGTIAAGQPIEAIVENEVVSIPEELVGDLDCYALRVRGNSMIEDGIYDGDFVVIERDYYPENGDVVVALLNNETATLKRYFRERGRIRLQPANAKMKPIYTKNPSIQGKVRALFRKF